MKITILGSGTSTGVPQIGCTCEVCTSKDLRDVRLRCSSLVEVDGVRILIDCSPDFREQMLRYTEFGPIDAVLITHEHYDHVGGLDDLRPYCQFKDVPVYAETYTAERLQQRIPYCFVEHPYPGVPRIPLNMIEPGRKFTVSGMLGNTIDIIPFRVMHGKMPILAYRIGNMAWVTDMTEIPDENLKYLENLDCLFMNALRLEPHWTHQSLPQAIERAQKISPKETYFIHASHHIGLHSEVEKMLPEGMYQTYDGMVIEF